MHSKFEQEVETEGKGQRRTSKFYTDNFQKDNQNESVKDPYSRRPSHAIDSYSRRSSNFMEHKLQECNDFDPDNEENWQQYVSNHPSQLTDFPQIPSIQKKALPPLAEDFVHKSAKRIGEANIGELQVNSVHERKLNPITPDSVRENVHESTEDIHSFHSYTTNEFDNHF